METISAIGVMSGSSLDGLDLAWCEFNKTTNWSFRIMKVLTFPFSEEWRLKLTSLPSKNQQGN